MIKIRNGAGTSISLNIDESHLLGAYVQQKLVAEMLNEQLALFSPDGTKLLDVGAGTRPYERLYRERFSRTYAIDIPSSQHKVNVDCFASVLALPFPSETFDLVLCTEVLEHVPEPAGALAEIKRVLRPRGKLLLSVPLMQAEHEIPHDYFRYTRYGLVYLLRKTGFSSTTIIPIGDFISSTLLFAMKPLWKIFSLLARRFRWPSLASRWNPVLFCGIIIPGWLCIQLYRRGSRSKFWGRIYNKLTYQPLGYFVVAQR